MTTAGSEGTDCSDHISLIHQIHVIRSATILCLHTYYTPAANLALFSTRSEVDWSISACWPPSCSTVWAFAARYGLTYLFISAVCTLLPVWAPQWRPDIATVSWSAIAKWSTCWYDDSMLGTGRSRLSAASEAYLSSLQRFLGVLLFLAIIGFLMFSISSSVRACWAELKCNKMIAVEGRDFELWLLKVEENGI